MAAPQSLDIQASGTALATAYLRALAAQDPGIEIRNSDGLAEIFLPDEQKRTLKDPVLRAWVMQNKIAPGAYEFMLARTAFFDQIVAQALRQNLAQLVFLGAGYDSRPYRFAHILHDTIVFEADAGPTQQRKRECLRAAGIEVPSQVRFVTVNFGTEDLAGGLAAAGFNAEKHTLVVWEGVSYYLGGEAVDRVFNFVKSDTAPGSSICFDYAALSDQALDESGARQIRQHLRSEHALERTRFGIPAGQIGSFLASRGFQILQHLTAEEMTRTYVPGRSRVPSLFCLVHACST